MIKLQKIEVTEIESLQNLLHNFISLTSHRIRVYVIGSEEYLNELLLLEISKKMFYTFRNKVEKGCNKNTRNITLSISEAVILFKCCTDAMFHFTPYEKYIQEKYKNELHKQLVNIN